MTNKIWKRAILVIVILSLFVCGGLGLFQTKKSKYKEAQKALEENRLTDAREAFQSLSGYENSDLYIKYIDAVNEMKEENYNKAATLFGELGGFLDSSEQAKMAKERELAKLYSSALEALSKIEYDEAIQLLEKTTGYQDTAKYLIYAHAMKMGEHENYETAILTFSTLGSFKDSDLQALYYRARELETHKEYEEAEKIYITIASFRDSQKRIDAIPNLICARKLEDARNMVENGDLENAIEEMKLLVSEGYEPATGELSNCYTLLGDTKDEDLAEAYRLYSLAGNEEKKKAIEEKYLAAQKLFNSGDFKGASEVFGVLNTYADSQEKRLESIYNEGEKELKEGHWNSAEKIYSELGTYRDSEIKALEARYGKANELAEDKDWEEAEKVFLSMSEYSDSLDRAKEAAYKQGRNHFERDELSSAMDCFVRAQEYDDSKVYIERIWYIRGVENLTNEKYNDARDCFLKAENYADARLKALETWYIEGQKSLANKTFIEASNFFALAGEYGDAKMLENYAKYNHATELLDAGSWKEASDIFGSLANKKYADSETKKKQADYSGAVKALNNKEWAEAKERFEALGDYQDSVNASTYAAAQSLLMVGADEKAYELFKKVKDYRDVNTILSSDRMKNINTQEISIKSKGLTMRLPKDWTVLTIESPESAYDNLEFTRDDFLVFMQKEGLSGNGVFCHAFDNTNRELTIEIEEDVRGTLREIVEEDGELSVIQNFASSLSTYGIEVLNADLEEINGVLYCIGRATANNENIVAALGDSIDGKMYFYYFVSDAGSLSDTQITFMREVLESVVYD